jgi:predicted PurR-regulated permease PerM
MRSSDTNRSLSQLVLLVILVSGIAALYFARAVLVPFALALLFAFLLTPIVRWLDRIRIPRVLSSVAVVSITVIALGFLGWTVTGQLIDVANQLPAYRLNIKKKIESLRGPRNQDIHNATQALNEIGTELIAPAPSSTDIVKTKDSNTANSSKPFPVQVVPPVTNPLESLNGLIGPVSTFGIVTVFTLFMLLRREDLRNRFIRLIGRRHLSALTQALDDASNRISRYLILQLVVNAGYGAVIAVGLKLLGIPHVLLWGVIATLLRFVPYIGSLLSSVLPILLSFAMFEGWTRPVLTLLLYLAAELITANLVEPLLYAAHVGLSSLAILVAAVFWTVLWGPIGLVLSTPLTVCLVVIGRYVPNLGFLKIMLGDEPVLKPESHFYQRLLAADSHEARSVLEECLKEQSLLEVYESVLIPALVLAERDRHRNDLDEATQRFISENTRSLVEEVYEKRVESETQESWLNEFKNSDGAELAAPACPYPLRPIVCIPSRDEADEIAAAMLAQLLEQLGQNSHCLALGTKAELLKTLRDLKPAIICISALPPLAFAHARHLYLQMYEAFPEAQILIGLWGYPGDLSRISNRMRLREADHVFGTLREMVTHIHGQAGVEADPNIKERHTTFETAVSMSVTPDVID